MACRCACIARKTKSRVVRPSQPGALGGLAAHRQYSARWHRQPSPVRERQTRAQLDEPTNDLDLEVLRRLEQVSFRAPPRVGTHRVLTGCVGRSCSLAQARASRRGVAAAPLAGLCRLRMHATLSEGQDGCERSKATAWTLRSGLGLGTLQHAIGGRYSTGLRPNRPPRVRARLAARTGCAHGRTAGAD